MITHKLVRHRATLTRVYEVEGVEPVPMSGTMPTLYTPAQVTVTIENGSAYVSVHGPRVLKSGKPGTVHNIRSLSYCGERDRPEWLAEIVAETVRAAA